MVEDEDVLVGVLNRPVRVYLGGRCVVMGAGTFVEVRHLEAAGRTFLAVRDCDRPRRRAYVHPDAIDVP